MLYPFHAGLKSDLTLILRSDLAATIGIFYRYNYPNLVPQNRKPFLDELIDLLERDSVVLRCCRRSIFRCSRVFFRSADGWIA
jgi:hypothetical protein